MKREKTKRAGAVSKSKARPKTVEEYLALVPENSREAFMKLRSAVKSAVPADAVEAISYGIPAFKRNGVLVWFAAFSNHCSLFPTAEIIAQFKEELKGFPTSKGTIHFPLDKPIPTALVKKIVKARVARKESQK